MAKGYALTAALLALALAGPALAQEDAWDDLGLLEMPASQGSDLDGAVLSTFSLPHGPLALPGALERIRDAVRSGQPVSDADQALVGEYAGQAPIVLAGLLESPNGDASLDSHLDAVIPGGTTPVSTIDPVALRDLQTALQALSSDLFLYQMGSSLKGLGTTAYSRMGQANPEGGLDTGTAKTLSDGYLPGIQARIATAADELLGDLQ